MLLGTWEGADISCWRKKALIKILAIKKKNTQIPQTGINLTKGIKDLYNKTYEASKKGIKWDIRKWKDGLCSWAGRVNTIKWSQTRKALQIQCSLYQNINVILHRKTNKQKVVRFTLKHRRSRILSKKKKKKKKGAGITILDFKRYYRVILTKIYDKGTRTDT